LWAKLAAFRTLYTLKRFRGDWEMDERSKTAQFWAFAIGDFCANLSWSDALPKP